MHGTVQARDVKRDQHHQAIRTTGGYVRLFTTLARTFATSTAPVTPTPITAQPTLVESLQDFVSKGHVRIFVEFENILKNFQR